MTETEPLTEKRAMLTRLMESRRQLVDALARVPADTLERPGLWGEQSLKDLIAHLAFWQKVGLERLQKHGTPAWSQIRWYDPSEVDEVNATVYRSNKDQSLADLMAIFETTHLAFRTAVKSIAQVEYQAEQVPMSLRAIVADDGYQHDEEHLPDVERVLQTLTPEQ